jgi:hypothetical protein
MPSRHRGEVYVGIRRYSSTHLDPGARRGWVVNAKPLPLYPREKTRYPFYRRPVGLGAGLDGSGKSRHTRVRIPDPTARSESLYRLRYPGSRNIIIIIIIIQFIQVHLRAESTARGSITGTAQSNKNTNIGDKTYRPNIQHKRILQKENTNGDTIQN